MGLTELSNRKKAVLEAIIKAYIETGEPIGSKILTSLLENAPSSATLRNEMNELCALGFLTQPHTSAGRIPTSLGYSLYVNNLMKPLSLGDSTKNYIDSSLASVSGDISAIPEAAAKALSHLTGFPAIVYYKVSDDVYLKSAELLAVGRCSVLLLAVTSDGRAFNRLCSIPSGVTSEQLEDFSKLVSKKLRRCSLESFNKATLQNITASVGISSFELLPVIAELFDMVGGAHNSFVSIKGKSGLYRLFGEQQAQRLISLSSRADSLINALEGEGQVIFGNDTELEELSDKALVLSKYNIKNLYCGKIGIIGQGRMSYEQIIPSIEYAAEKLSALMTAAVKNMED